MLKLKTASLFDTNLMKKLISLAARLIIRINTIVGRFGKGFTFWATVYVVT